MQFKNIIGQEKIKERLIRSVKDGRISHAQLFIGSDGYGKLPLAIAYAQYISCEGEKQNDSCGECPSCLKYQKLVHPDLHFVFPVVKNNNNNNPVSDNYIQEWRKIISESPYFTINTWLEYIGSENRQGLIYTHESNEIIKKLNFKSFESEYKIMIIWSAEKMHAVAANKLLKLIEEPPPKTLFILLSESPEQMLPTIVSRAQLLKIPKIDSASLASAIIKDHNLDKPKAENIIHLANGDFIKAQNIINSNEEYIYNFELFSKLMRLCYGKNITDILQFVDDMASLGREKQKSFLVYGLGMFRESFILNTSSGQRKELVCLADHEIRFSEDFSVFVNEWNIDKIAEEFNKAHYHIERNGYSRIVFLDLSLKLTKLIKKR